MVRALTGATTATYTTGPATRHALREAGARAATTRTTVHLPASPEHTDAGLLAHELRHARTALVRPRFSLHAHCGAADTEERAAQAAGSAFSRAATLPVRGSGGGAPAQRGTVVQAAPQPAHDVVPAETTTATATASGTTEPAAPAHRHPTVEELVLAVERRVLGQLERRGGRYPSAF